MRICVGLLVLACGSAFGQSAGDEAKGIAQKEAVMVVEPGIHFSASDLTIVGGPATCAVPLSRAGTSAKPVPMPQLSTKPSAVARGANPSGDSKTLDRMSVLNPTPSCRETAQGFTVPETGERAVAPLGFAPFRAGRKPIGRPEILTPSDWQWAAPSLPRPNAVR